MHVTIIGTPIRTSHKQLYITDSAQCLSHKFEEICKC